MKSFKEMRREAWKTANTRWSFRLILVMCIFTMLGSAIFVPLAKYFQDNSIQTWEMFRKTQLQFELSGLDMEVPSAQQFWTMTWASSLESFLEYLFCGLLIFGVISVALKAVRREDEHWFSSAFGGFRAPLEMLWLNVVMTVRIMLWSLLFLIPGIIAAFRYSMAWYIKSDHPEYSASQCLAESGKMMKGHKWNLFFYGISYFGWILLAGILMGVVAAFARDIPALALGGMAVSWALLMFTFVYMIFGQAVYYAELKRISESDTTENPTAEASAESADL